MVVSKILHCDSMALSICFLTPQVENLPPAIRQLVASEKPRCMDQPPKNPLGCWTRNLQKMGWFIGSTIRTLWHEKINPKNWQVLTLGDVGFLLFSRVVSGDYGKPCLLRYETPMARHVICDFCSQDPLRRAMDSNKTFINFEVQFLFQKVDFKALLGYHPFYHGNLRAPTPQNAIPI